MSTLQQVSLLCAKALPILAMINSAIDVYIERRNRWKFLKASAMVIVFAALAYMTLFAS
jgi:hypothetical protein